MTYAAMAALNALPDGATYGTAYGRRFLATKTTYAEGKSLKLEARALDGSNYISLNAYHLTDNVRIFPCEMPLAKVLAFLAEFTPYHAQDHG